MPAGEHRLENRYRIERKLGEGGMGAVYLALDETLQQHVAIKTLLPAIGQDPRAVEKLKREVRTAQKLRHENICATYDFRDGSGTPFVVMEYVDGETLSGFLHRQPGGRCDEATFWRLAEQILLAVEYAHKAGVVHRDLKPSNIQVKPDGGIRLMDFGIAASLKEVSSEVTGSTITLSIRYAAPEQINGGVPSPSMDIYSLGCVFYEMLSGEPPFARGDILHQHLTRVPGAIPGISALLNKGLLWCLEKDPDRRCRDLAMLRTGWASAQGQFGVSDPDKTVVLDRFEDRDMTVRLERDEPGRGASDGLGGSQAGIELASSGPSGGASGWNGVAAQPVEQEAAVVPPPYLPRKSMFSAETGGISASGRGRRVGLFLLVSATMVLVVVLAGVVVERERSGAGMVGDGVELPALSRTGDLNESEKKAPLPIPPGPVPLGPQPGKSRLNPRDGQLYSYIPAGKFTMGCSPGDEYCDVDEEPNQEVAITKGFWLGQTEVTVDAYRRFATATGRGMPPEPVFLDRALNAGWANGKFPMVNVDWNDAVAYCEWSGGRMPTEGEWEYAARGGTSGSRYGELDSVAWYGDNAGRSRLDTVGIWSSDRKNYRQRISENGNTFHVVAQKAPNEYGLYDMLGNVSEWAADWYSEKYYQSRDQVDPQGPPTGKKGTLRGGSWIHLPQDTRASVRDRLGAGLRRSELFGFRCLGD